MQLPKLLAHRGASAIAPENTLSALEQAKALGASWVEFDVELSKDDQPMVFHDWRLSRTSDGAGWLRSCMGSTLAQLDVGSYFSPEYQGEMMPSFEQYVLMANDLGLNLNIELKALTHKQAVTLAQGTKQLLARHHLTIELLISSGHKSAIKKAQELMPCVPRALVAERINQKVIADALAMSCVSVNVNQAKVRELDIALAHEYQLGVLVWTVNDVHRVKALFELGVDGIFSDVVFDPKLNLGSENETT